MPGIATGQATDSLSVHFEVGSEIDVVIALPEELGSPLSGMVCCHARVVRSDFGVSQIGVAAQIDRFAAMPQV